MRKSAIVCCFSVLSACATSQHSTWLLVDDFEQGLTNWHKVDTQNNTKPFIENPQVTEIRREKTNHFLIKKPAKDGVIGNRKALTFKALPVPVNVGETFTFYTRIQVERFPNNHAFGLSNLTPDEIVKAGYNAFEPTLRVTDKAESNGHKNTGALMVKISSNDKYRQYDNIQHYAQQRDAKPLVAKQWYQIWYVVNNALKIHGGQTYRVYVQGGEFVKQTLVYEKADFRMQREQPLISFLANCNTGPLKQPYGNGGLAFDDIFMIKGVNLSNPTNMR
ncbi:hypothetical protein Q4489_11235 [Thalassotalea sp. 1_MG-2023]|uniref:hypothetical protein n=1 Tax=Thalassotalea sp. 1_MG-2023 TaxID=3062680 RepID=UPI0026E3C961|nr:hypothetical protein [Thalassotalea sp. 1_MG-2023]MDO6427593.1 hypothetical protein [Thalassotalea sp. 1_MG-2023]